MAKITLDEMRRAPARLTPAEAAQLDAKTNANIERDAATDSINPAWTDVELDRAVFARLVRQTREKLNLTQVHFAAQFGFNLRRLQDIEQARFNPDTAIVAYVKVIAKEPRMVQKALEVA